MWKCKCGEENPDSSTFCQSCGTKISHIFNHSDVERMKNEVRQKELKEKLCKEEEERKKREEEKRKQEEERKRQEEFYAEQERRRTEEREKNRIRIQTLKNMGHDGYYEYKTISLMDESGLFKQTGRVNIQKMTEIMNELGQDGWHLVTAYSNELGKNSTSIGGFGTNSTLDEHILIFERFIRFDA